MKISGKSTHKAVAPIIATLLMVAVAVVGGILIFVFTQGFFADEQAAGPTVDNIKIFGYDAADGTDIESLDAASLTCANAAANAKIATNDCIAIYVSNLGDKPTSIESVRVFGETYTVGSDTTDATCDTTAGEFLVMKTDETVTGIIEPNKDATICIKYTGNDIKAGRTIPVQVQTANGQSSQINIFTGDKRGQIDVLASEAGCTIVLTQTGQTFISDPPTTPSQYTTQMSFTATAGCTGPYVIKDSLNQTVDGCAEGATCNSSSVLCAFTDTWYIEDSSTPVTNTSNVISPSIHPSCV